MSDFSEISEESNSPEVLEEQRGVTEFVSGLFDTKKRYDVTFEVNGIEYRAHKLILSRFDYFDSMFSNWEEGKENKIPIRNVTPEIFNIMLEFIYKGRLVNWRHKMKQHSVDLLKAANMYGIDGLLKSCEKYIIRSDKIKVETACEYLIMADKHNASQLKTTVLKFISKNLEEVQKTSGYVELRRYNLLLTTCFETISPSKRQRLD